jgi:hypothetical protein
MRIWRMVAIQKICTKMAMTRSRMMTTNKTGKDLKKTKSKRKRGGGTKRRRLTPLDGYHIGTGRRNKSKGRPSGTGYGVVSRLNEA